MLLNAKRKFDEKLKLAGQIFIAIEISKRVSEIAFARKDKRKRECGEPR